MTEQLCSIVLRDLSSFFLFALLCMVSIPGPPHGPKWLLLVQPSNPHSISRKEEGMNKKGQRASGLGAVFKQASWKLLHMSFWPELCQMTTPSCKENVFILQTANWSKGCTGIGARVAEFSPGVSPRIQCALPSPLL